MLPQEHEVEKMFTLKGNRLPAADVKNIIFLVRPRLELMDIIAENVLRYLRTLGFKRSWALKGFFRLSYVFTLEGGCVPWCPCGVRKTPGGMVLFFHGGHQVWRQVLSPAELFLPRSCFYSGFKCSEYLCPVAPSCQTVGRPSFGREGPDTEE